MKNSNELEKEKRAAIKEHNNEIIYRLKKHFGLKTQGEVLERWGQHPLAMNNWHKTGIPESELALLAMKENLSFDWLLKGEGEKDVVPVPMANLVAEPSSEYGGALGRKICRSFAKIPDAKKEQAYKDVISTIVEHY